ncbi:MAG TPA: hypothetical protein IAC11_05070 [Candidatus Limiplasma pullicola]|nr:hypothetical protein [Candidatus Limiplasma pullicola]
MMTGWFRRARQTLSTVKNREEAQRQQRRAACAAYRTLGVLQLAAQLMLWVTLYAYDRLVQTTWQAALLLALPLAGLWALWRGGEDALATRNGARLTLLLLPCLMLDAAVLLRTLGGYISQLIPEYPLWACTVVPAALCWLTVLLSRENGAAYGASLLRFLLLGLFLLATVFLNTNAHPVRLWPLLGQGPGRTAAEALAGAGSGWGVALLFVLPLHSRQSAAALSADRHAAGRAAVWTAVPWLMCVIWALWYAMVRPWRSGDMLEVGERLMGLARHSHSPLLYECSSLMWMLLLPLALTGCAVSGEKLLRSTLPRVPRSVAALLPLLPGAAAALIWPDDLLGALGWALPWRALISAAAGGALWALSARKGREAHAG